MQIKVSSGPIHRSTIPVCLTLDLLDLEGSLRGWYPRTVFPPAIISHFHTRLMADEVRPRLTVGTGAIVNKAAFPTHLDYQTAIFVMDSPRHPLRIEDVVETALEIAARYQVAEFTFPGEHWGRALEVGEMAALANTLKIGYEGIRRIDVRFKDPTDAFLFAKEVQR